MRISVTHADKDKKNPLSSGFMEMREAEGTVYDYFSHEISIILEGSVFCPAQRLREIVRSPMQHGIHYLSWKTRRIQARKKSQSKGPWCALTLTMTEVQLSGGLRPHMAKVRLH